MKFSALHLIAALFAFPHFALGVTYGQADLNFKDSRTAKRVVRIDLPGGFRCSGTLIGPKTVLTALHCFLGTSGETYVTFVSSSPAGVPSEIRRKVVGKVSPPQKTPVKLPTGEYYVEKDMAVLSLDQVAPAGFVVTSLAFDESFDKSCRYFVSGYGLTEKNLIPDTPLTKTPVVMEVRSDRLSEMASLSADFSKKNLWGLELRGQPNVGPGDSGAGLIKLCQGFFGESTEVVAIASSGNEGGTPAARGKFLTLNPFKLWLSQTLPR